MSDCNMIWAYTTLQIYVHGKRSLLELMKIIVIALVKQTDALKVPLATLNQSTEQKLGYICNNQEAIFSVKVSECVDKFQIALFV